MDATSMENTQDQHTGFTQTNEPVIAGTVYIPWSDLT